MKRSPEQIEILPGEVHPQFLTVGKAARRIAVLRRFARKENAALPGLIWLGGFKSDMQSVKACFLDQWAERQGRSLIRFDYSGHGLSEGRFEDGTIGLWLEEALAVMRSAGQAPQILVGSSMGAWLALLAARAFAASKESGRLHGLVLIAPAVDFTEALVFSQLDEKARRQLETDGVWLRPSAYGSPYPITRALIEDGRRHLLLDGPIRAYCPIHILQGMCDMDVPWRHTMTLIEHLAGDPVALTLIKDGEHRLSRDKDLMLLRQAIESIDRAPSH